MEYGKLISSSGVLSAAFIANQIAGNQAALLRSQMDTPVRIGTSTNKVEVPGFPGRYYVQNQDPGCRPRNLIIRDASGGYKNFPPGGAGTIKLPPRPGPPLSPGHPGKPSPPPPGGAPYTPPITPPAPGGYPYFPAPMPDNNKNGAKPVDNCPLLDTGPAYGDFNFTTDITAAIMACAHVPCGYQVYRATVKYMYDSFVGDNLDLNPFDDDGPKDGQGDNDHFLKFIDAKGQITYAALRLINTRTGPIMYQFLQGIGSVTLDLLANTETTIPGPVVASGKGNDVPPPFHNGTHGRVALFLTAIEYRMPDTVSASAKVPPLIFDFRTVQNSTQGWEGSACRWYPDWDGSMYCNSASYRHPVYLSGGTYVSECKSRVLIGQGGHFGFGCALGGTPNVELVHSEGHSVEDGFYQLTETWRVGEGLYTINVGGSGPTFRSIKLT